MSRSKTVIMHISDMHFGIPPKRQTADDRERMLNTFIDSFSKIPAELKPDILVVSGDIAWSGAESDYEQAKDFFNKFFNKINEDEDTFSRSQVVVCFGNHDADTNSFIDFEPDRNACTAYDIGGQKKKFVYRPPSSQTGTSEDRALNDPDALMVADVESLFHRFENAESFCCDMGFAVLTNSLKKSKYRHAYGACRVQGVEFVCLNTEWDFWGKDDKDSIAKGHLRVGLDLYNAANRAVEKKSGCSFKPFRIGTPARFVVYHRSLDYLHESEQLSDKPFDSEKCVGNLIHQNDVSLNGHEHMPGIVKYDCHTRIMAGAVHSTDTKEFTCNLIVIPKKLNQGLNECELWEYCYCPGDWQKPCQPTKPWHYIRNDSFNIVRLRDDTIPDFLKAFKKLKDIQSSGNGSVAEIKAIESRIDDLLKEMSDDDFPVLMGILPGDVFKKILDYANRRKLMGNPIKPLPTKSPGPGQKPDQKRHSDTPIDIGHSADKNQSLEKSLGMDGAPNKMPSGSGNVPVSNSIESKEAVSFMDEKHYKEEVPHERDF